MRDIWFTSDPHYFHFNVIRYCSRPYQDVEEMNQALVDNWNNLVKPLDTIFCLGDFSLSHRAVEVISPRLMGHKLLIPGNHDYCHSAHKKGKKALEKWKQFYVDNGWFIQGEQIQLNLPDIGVVNVCHMPYQGDSTDERYQDFRMKDDGRILLCGHVHEKWKTKRTPNGTLMINVGVDVWGMSPVSLTQIKELILHEQSV